MVLSALLEHVPSPERVLHALLPLLAARGRIVVYVPADRWILALKRVLARLRLGGLVRGLSLEPAPGHLRVFTRAGLSRVLSRAGRVAAVTFDPLVLGWVAVVRPPRGRRG